VAAAGAYFAILSNLFIFSTVAMFFELSYAFKE
jgi:hypothetical protein